MGFLGERFSKRRDEVWQELSRQIGADFVEGHFTKGARVTASRVTSIGEWTVMLDTYTVTTGKTYHVFTRLRAPYVNRDGFRFKIYRRNIFSDLGAKLFGMQDIEVGFPEFDQAFVIKGSDPEKVCRLFGNAEIRRLLEQQPEVRFEVRDDEGWFGAKFPDGVDELLFTTHGVVKDIARLKALFDLFAATLDFLCEIGSAYRRAPEM